MGTIQILKNKAGRYYVRVKHDNGRILCHCQAVGSRETAIDIALEATKAPILLAIDFAKNGQLYFIYPVAAWEQPFRRFFSETYSTRQKAEQGLNAVIRICKEGVIEDLT